MMMDMEDVELISRGSSAAEDTQHQHQRQRHHQRQPASPQQPMTTVPAVQNSTGWVDHAVLSIATACNLCDVYVHEQVRFEWDNEEKDRNLDQSSFDIHDNLDKRVQIEVYKKFLFDESSIRIDDDFLDDGQSPLDLAASQK